MSVLDKVLSKAKIKPPIICLYGIGGIGKTTFASKMNNPIIIQCEDGIGKIECKHTKVQKTYTGFEEYLMALLEDDHDYKTVVVDSLDWLERLINDHVCKENGWPDISSPSFGKGFGAALVVWKNYLDILSRLRNEKGMTIMQIAHHEVKRYEDPSSDPIDKNGIKLYRKAADLVVEHADCVFFVKYKTGTVQKKNPKGGMSTQVLQGERTIYTQEGPGHHAKNRYGLPSEMDFDWPTIREAMIK